MAGTDRFDVFEKDYLETDGELRRIKPKSVMAGTAYSTDGATKALRELMPDVEFPNPKPVAFLSDLITYATRGREHDVVLDIFAGSGTTGMRCFDANALDGGNRTLSSCNCRNPPPATTIRQLPTYAKNASGGLSISGTQMIQESSA